jgi:hypothetical protein
MTAAAPEEPITAIAPAIAGAAKPPVTASNAPAQHVRTKHHQHSDSRKGKTGPFNKKLGLKNKCKYVFVMDPRTHLHRPKQHQSAHTECISCVSIVW